MGKWEPGLEGSAIQQTGQPTSAGHINNYSMNEVAWVSSP